MSDVVVRRIAPDEAEQYVAMRREMLIDTPAAFSGTVDDDSMLDVEQVRKWCDHDVFGLFGAFDGSGTLLAAAGFHRDERSKSSHKSTIWGVYTTPLARRRGLGRRVMEVVLEHAAGLEGLRVVQLSVSESTPGAERLYASLGFEVWGTEPDATVVDGELLAERHMWRRV